MAEWLAGWTDEQTDGQMIDGQTDAWMNGCMEGRMGGWVSGQTIGQMEGWAQKAGRNIVKETENEGKVEHTENGVYNLRGGIKAYSSLNLQSCI